ncbi:MAG: hypothetical protein WCO23_02240 [bacterium]
MKNALATIYQSGKTVLTNRDIGILLGKTDSDNLKSSLAYFVKTKSLIRLRSGIFALNSKYDPNELATSIYLPSYLSLETVLSRSGVTFQYFETIFVISHLSRTLEIDGRKIIFTKIKDEVLYNPKGIDFSGKYPIASEERAFLDRIYLTKDYFFDNLRAIDFEKAFLIAPIYKNKQLTKRLKSYYADYARQNKTSIDNGANS